MQKILNMYSEISEGLGELKGEVHVTADEMVTCAVHTLRRLLCFYR